MYSLTRQLLLGEGPVNVIEILRSHLRSTNGRITLVVVVVFFLVLSHVRYWNFGVFAKHHLVRIPFTILCKLNDRQININFPRYINRSLGSHARRWATSSRICTFHFVETPARIMSYCLLHAHVIKSETSLDTQEYRLQITKFFFVGNYVYVIARARLLTTLKQPINVNIKAVSYHNNTLIETWIVFLLLKPDPFDLTPLINPMSPGYLSI